MATPRIGMVAGEASGDLLARAGRFQRHAFSQPARWPGCFV